MLERTLTTKARDNHDRTYDVTIRPWGRGGNNKLVLDIVDTPGSWFLTTLLSHYDKSCKTISIDWGQNWECINFDEIMSEVLEVL